MRKSIRSLSLVLVFCLLAAFLPMMGDKAMTAYADGDFTVENGVLKKYNGSGGDVVIPDGVTKIGGYAFNESGITSVTMPDSVTEISGHAFFKCAELRAVKLSPSLTTIDVNAFSGCSALDGVWLPDSLTYLADGAFADCTSLTSVTVPDNLTVISCRAFKNCQSLTSIQVADGNAAYTSVDGVLLNKDKTSLHTYPAGKSAVSYAVPDPVTAILDYAFSDCVNLQKVVLPEGLKTIGYDAFYASQNLSDVTLPSSLETIGSHAFQKCAALTGIRIPASVTKIKYGAFAECPVLSVIKVEEGNTAYAVVDDMLMTADGTTVIAFPPASDRASLTMPDTVTSIEWGAFYDCRKLQSVTLSPAVKSVENYAFTGCTGLTDVTIPSGVRQLGYEMFYGCTSLTSVTIPSTVTLIATYCFSRCTSLQTVNLLANAPKLGSYPFLYTKVKTVNYAGSESDWAAAEWPKAFSSSPAVNFHYYPDFIIEDGELTDYTGKDSYVTVPGTVTTIGESAFSNRDYIKEISIPASVTDIDTWTFDGCTALTAINVASGNTAYASKNGVLYDRDTTELIRYPAAKAEEAFTVPSTVTTLCDSAFYGCGALTSVTLPDGLEDIGRYAFEGCTGLTAVTVPAKVTTVGKYAFDGCTALRTVTASAKSPAVGVYVFADCPVDTVWYAGTGDEWNASGWKKVLGSATVICDYADAFTIVDGVLTKYTGNGGDVTVPSGVTAIGKDAFRYCTSLTGVTIPGSVTTVGDYAFYYCTALKSVSFASGPKTIGVKAFSNCTSLKSVTLPSGVTTVGKEAFSYCESLTSVTVPASVTSIGDCLFDSCTALTAINVASGNPDYCSVDGVLFNKNKTTLLCYPAGKTAASYTVPSTVTTIGNSALYNCDSLTSVTLPASVKVLDRYALSRCDALTSITVPAGVTTVNHEAFSDCDVLRTVTLLAKSPSVSDTAFEESPVQTVNYAGSEAEWNASDWKGAFDNSPTVTYNSSSLSITQQPANVTGAVGATATFTVKAAGSGLTYQWYIKKSGESSFTAWNGKTTASVSTPIYQSWDKAQFYCLVKDSGGHSVKSNTVTLSVNPIKITTQPADASGAVGGTATFSVTATGGTLSYQWYMKKTSDSSFKAWNGKTTASVSTPVYASWDKAQFYCLVKDDKGHAVKTNTVKLTVVPIQITQQPANAAGAVGGTATFSVTAAGSNLTYQWYVKKTTDSSFTAWNGKTTASVSTPIYQSWDKAQFYCLVKDSGGHSVKSNTVKLTVAPITITKQPANVSGAIDATATFSVTATGSHLTYQWYIKKSGDASFAEWNKKTDATASTPVYANWNNAQFYCLIKDDKGNSLKTNTVKLTVTLKITQQPVSVSGAVSDTATFTVKATGAGLSYQWYIKKATESSFSAWNNKKGASISTPVYASWNNAQFYCVVKDANGKNVQSNTVKLTVLPKITQQPKNASGAVGDTATFTVKATGFNLTYHWYYKKSGESSFTAWNNKKDASVSTPIYASWHNAQFYCVVKDGNGKTVQSNTVKLTVAAIQITQQPKNASGAVGDTATFSVTATGSNLSYQWYLKKASDASFTAWNGKTSASVSTPIYQSWNGAQFYCLVKDDKGNSVKSNTVKLTVQ